MHSYDIGTDTALRTRDASQHRRQVARAMYSPSRRPPACTESSSRLGECCTRYRALRFCAPRPIVLHHRFPYITLTQVRPVVLTNPLSHNQVYARLMAWVAVPYFCHLGVIYLLIFAAFPKTSILSYATHNYSLPISTRADLNHRTQIPVTPPSRISPDRICRHLRTRSRTCLHTVLLQLHMLPASVYSTMPRLPSPDPYLVIRVTHRYIVLL